MTGMGAFEPDAVAFCERRGEGPRVGVDDRLELGGGLLRWR